jgi:hypothetical protein
MVAFVGVGLQDALLAMMTLVGGGVYVVSLAIIGVFFLRQPKAEVV